LWKKIPTEKKMRLKTRIRRTAQISGDVLRKKGKRKLVTKKDLKETKKVRADGREQYRKEQVW